MAKKNQFFIVAEVKYKIDSICEMSKELRGGGGGEDGPIVLDNSMRRGSSRYSLVGKLY